VIYEYECIVELKPLTFLFIVLPYNMIVPFS